MKKITFILCILLFGIYSCQRKSNKKTPIENPVLQPISLGIIPTLEGLPFHVAKAMGIYDSLGLEVNLLHFNSAIDRDATFQAHQIDGMITDYLAAIIQNANHHTELSLIMKNDGYFCFIVSKESLINQLYQLKQKSIAISRNTLIEYATDELLNKENISNTEVNRPEIGQVPLRLKMLQYNQVDASFLPEPMASIAMSTQHHSLISTRELGIDFTATAFSQKAIDDKKEEIRLLIAGYNLGIDYIKMHPQKELNQVLIDMGVPEPLTGLIALPSYKKAIRPSNESIHKAFEWLKKNHRIPESYPMNKNLIDTTFIRKNVNNQNTNM